MWPRCSEMAQFLLLSRTGGHAGLHGQTEIAHMKWETPAYNDVRFGFEVTMYINNK